jgi:GT2 family glycosyltransferase
VEWRQALCRDPQAIEGMNEVTHPLRCAVMITTHNRLTDLRLTCSHLCTLDPAPDEWLFTADGCTDGTSRWLEEAFPGARLFVNSTCNGSVNSRHGMLLATTCDLVLALDDDSYPLEPDAITRLRTFHQDNPEVAVSTFPQRSEEYRDSLDAVEFAALGETSSFPNSGACFRSAVYRKLEGFPGLFFHAFEEPDYALQCQHAGFKVVHTAVITIRHHFTSAGRNEIRTHQRHARNECWSVIMRCPFPQMPLVLIYKAASQFVYAVRRGPAWIVREPIWWLRALQGGSTALRHRKPVSWKSYRRWLLLMSPLTKSAQTGE